MPNDLLVQPETSLKTGEAFAGVALDAGFGVVHADKPLLVGLYENIRDVFFPVRLPPLELTSKPIPVPDRMAVKANPWAIGAAAFINIGILTLLLVLGVAKVVDTLKKNNLSATDVDVSTFIAPKSATTAGGGGGGGDHSLADPIKGKLPKIERNPIVPPQVQKLDNPKIPMESAIDVQKNIVLPDNPTLPNIGIKSSANVKLDSNGQGSNGGMGTGSRSGLGSGNGNGFGPGEGGNAGGGLYRVGGGVSAPVVIFEPEAEFSDEARRAKYQGVVVVSIIVDAQGNPQNPRVVRALGMGLDEKAIEAVRKYKIKPAMKDGKTPVPVMMSVEINFRLY
jgi:TonB family protein